MSYTKNVAMGTDELEMFVEAYITTEYCEFPVKGSSKRSKNQRKKAAKKNKFPVGLRKEIFSVRRDIKRCEMLAIRRVQAKSEKKIMQVILGDVEKEKEFMRVYGDPFHRDPFEDYPYEDELFYEFWNWEQYKEQFQYA